jgi:quercetin dioxygenase-like cupin family protein
MAMLRMALAFGGVLALAAPVQAQMNSKDLKWSAAPPVFPKGAQMAVLSGNPGAKGPFVVRLKMPAGYRIPAHHHPTDEYVTVISGDLGLGMGDKLDTAKSAHLAAGGFAEAPGRMHHFAWTKGGAVVQISAEGPFAMTYVNPADDPTRH